MADNQLHQGDKALIIGAKGSFELVGQCCEVIDLHRGVGLAACRGRVMTCVTHEPCAFIELRDGSVWLWSVANLMKLRGALAPVQKMEVAHG